jgi:hypothetical protein
MVTQQHWGAQPGVPATRKASLGRQAAICIYMPTDNIDLPTGESRRPTELPNKLVAAFCAAGRLHNLYCSQNVVKVVQSKVMP